MGVAGHSGIENCSKCRVKAMKFTDKFLKRTVPSRVGWESLNVFIPGYLKSYRLFFILYFELHLNYILN